MSVKELIVNAGSSSLKYTVYLMPEEEVLCNGIFEQLCTKTPTFTHKLPDENGNFCEGGFRVVFGDGEDAISVYHAGDCCLYDGLEERVMDSDIMILPVNGRDYYRLHEKDIIGNFDCTEAVTLAKRCHTDLLIPVHSDLYDVNALNPAIFVDTLEKLSPQQKYHLFRPGERMIYCK